MVAVVFQAGGDSVALDALLSFLRGLNVVGDVLVILMGWIVWGLFRSFRVGAWYTKHQDRLSNFDTKLAAIEKTNAQTEERFTAANARMSKLAGEVQSLHERMRDEMREVLVSYPTREVVDLLVASSEKDRERVWRELDRLSESINRNRRMRGD